MNFKVEKRVGVRAPSDRIWEIIADLPGWDQWNPIETGAAGTIAFGGSISLTERIEPSGTFPKYTTGIRRPCSQQMRWTLAISS